MIVKEICSECEGSGVIQKITPWGDSETPCDDCDGIGVIEADAEDIQTDILYDKHRDDKLTGDA